MVAITAGLRDALLDLARQEDPDGVNVVLAPTPAGEFEAGTGLDPETPVLTHLYFPQAGSSVNSVFGVDLGTPSGTGRARFVSHPDGDRSLRRTDDLAAVVIVAVPPWEAEEDSLAAYDRSGRRVDLTVVDAEPPHEEIA